MQQIYGRRRAVVETASKSPDDFELERLNRELKDVLGQQMSQLGVQLHAPPAARDFVNGWPAWDRRLRSVPTGAEDCGGAVWVKFEFPRFARDERSRRSGLVDCRPRNWYRTYREWREPLRFVVAGAQTNTPRRRTAVASGSVFQMPQIKTASYQTRPFLNRVASLILMTLVVVTLVLSGCSLMKHTAKARTKPRPSRKRKQISPAPRARTRRKNLHRRRRRLRHRLTVHIGYAHRNDYLESLSVAKFASASQISTRGLKSGSEVMRFEGGEPVWEIAADRGLSGSLLGHVPGVAENKKFAITGVTYGTQPKNFSKEVPENSDPEPLEQGKYYIFTVRRATGTDSYQAVHITMDGTIESYDAQPRVGTSYELCCDVAPDFASAIDSDSNGDAAGAGGGDTGGEGGGGDTGGGAGTSGFPEP